MSDVATLNAVRAVVEQYIDGSRRGDAALLRSIFHPNAVMVGWLNGKLLDGSPEMFFQMADGHPQPASYQATVADVRVTGRSATATLVEQGFAGLDFVDCFHLIEADGKWRICAKLFSHS